MYSFCAREGNDIMVAAKMCFSTAPDEKSGRNKQQLYMDGNI